jgi:hypothetical protein
MQTCVGFTCVVRIVCRFVRYFSLGKCEKVLLVGLVVVEPGKSSQ